MDKWEWSLNLFDNLNQIENWSYARHLQLSVELNKFFFSIYRNLREEVPAGEKQSIDQHDLTLLGRKLFVLFRKHKNKLQLTPFITKKRLILERCIFQFNCDKFNRSRWVLYDASRYPLHNPEKQSKIFSARRIVRTAAWLVINGLYDFHKTKIEMPPNPSGINVNDLIEILRQLQNFFRPSVCRIKMGENLNSDAVIDRTVIIAGLEKDCDLSNQNMTDLVYTNSWGEAFTAAYLFHEALAVVKKSLADRKIVEKENIDAFVQVLTPKYTWPIHTKTDIYRQISLDQSATIPN